MLLYAVKLFIEKRWKPCYQDISNYLSHSIGNCCTDWGLGVDYLIIFLTNLKTLEGVSALCYTKWRRDVDYQILFLIILLNFDAVTAV